MASPKRSISVGVLIICLILLAFYIRSHLADFKNISSVSFSYTLIIGLVSALSLIVNGLFLKALTIDFGIDLNFAEYFSLSIVTSFGNIFLPMKGGAGFRAVYLKSRYNFDYSYFLSSLAGNYLVAFHVTSWVALAGTAALYIRTGGIQSAVTAVFFGVALLTGGAYFFLPLPSTSFRSNGQRRR